MNAFSDCTTVDSGLYTCLIKTVSGHSSSSAWVTVLEESPHNMTSITDILSFPASPSKPRLVSSGPDHLTVSWGKPHRVGASPLRGYQVEYYGAGLTGNHWVVEQVQQEEFSLENISNHTGPVTILVRARNEDGLSPPSPQSEPLYIENRRSEHFHPENKIRRKSELLKQISDKLVELEEVAVLGSKKVRLSWKVNSQVKQVLIVTLILNTIPGPCQHRFYPEISNSSGRGWSQADRKSKDHQRVWRKGWI